MASATGSPAGQARTANGAPYLLVGKRLWLDFVNSDGAGSAGAGAHRDALDSFDGFVGWLSAAGILGGERAESLVRRAQQQPTGSGAALHEARRLRSVLRALAERGDVANEHATETAMAEINRILGRSTGTRRVEPRADGSFVRSFVTAGDVFSGLMIPVIESAADGLVSGELRRIRKCADPRCGRVFYDGSRNGKRRWCDMKTCGNRAKAARHRRKQRE